MSKNLVVSILVIVGILFLVLAFFYFTRSASTLPSFFPGYQAHLTKIHYKHGLAALLLGLGCFILAWFQSGEKSTN